MNDNPSPAGSVPDFELFQKLSGQYNAVPVCRRLLADGLTPVAAFRRLDDGETGCLFESVTGGEKIGRYSFLATSPHKTLTATRDRVRIRIGHETIETVEQNPLHRLRAELQSVRVAPIAGLPPFAGGAIGYCGYDTVRYVENLPDAPPDDRELPDLSFSFFDRIVVFDNVVRTVSVIVLAWPAEHESAQAAWRHAQLRIEQTIRMLEQPDIGMRIVDVDPDPDCKQQVQLQSNMDQAAFESAVHRAVEYIRAGDIFQVVLSQRMDTELNCDPLEVYRTLRVLNPSPFMFFLRTRETTLVGSSPEIMCRVTGREVTVRPLAGTRWRGHTDDEDRRLERELLADPKERAEHVMLVDLGRNDVGRVARYGSINLPDLMVVERYSHVMHISSTVSGTLRDECDAFDALMSSLPAGTVSGAPKVRAMEIIDELETVRRGPYAGAVGYFDYAGNMDTCIALRTLVVTGNRAYVQAGAGIVADSDPASEYRETMNKALGLIRAIEMTQRRTAKAASQGG